VFVNIINIVENREKTAHVVHNLAYNVYWAEQQTRQKLLA